MNSTDSCSPVNTNLSIDLCAHVNTNLPTVSCPHVNTILCTDLCPPVSTALPTDLCSPENTKLPTDSCSPVIPNSSTDSCSHLNSNLFDVLTDHNYVLSQHSLRWYVLNVCGFKQKIKCPDLQKEIQYNDFVILTETKLDDIDVDNISKKLSDLGYFIFTKNRSHCSTHRSGGILVAIRNTLQNYCKQIESDCTACLWFSVDKCVFGYEKDLLCGAVYLPPEGTKYSDINLFDDFEGDLLHINANKTFQVLMTGDEESLERLDIPVVRKTEDNVCNNYGRRFIEFCKMSTLYIFNERVGSDRSIGSYTTSRNSVVDYTIGSPSILSKCVNFEVLDFDPLFSDIHCTLQFSLKSNNTDTCAKYTTYSAID